jgi:hypothetical protein
LRSRSTGTIGLIIPNNTNPYFSEVARGIEDSCYAAGYSVILCNSDDDPVKQREYLNVLLTKRCDGLILSALADSDGELLRKMKVPAVLLDRAPSDLAIDAVAVDNRAGGLGRAPPAGPGTPAHRLHRRSPRSEHFQRAHRGRATPWRTRAWPWPTPCACMRFYERGRLCGRAGLAGAAARASAPTPCSAAMT